MEDRSYLSAMGNAEAKAMFQMQDWLVTVTSDVVESRKQQILNSIFIYQPINERQLVHCILNTIVYRPLCVKAMAQLLKGVFENIDLQKSKLRDIFLHDIALPSHCDYSHFNFYRELMAIDVYSEEEVVSEIVGFYEQLPAAEMNHLLLFAWFAPEIEKHNPCHFQRCLDISERSQDIHTRPDILHFFNNLPSFRENDYKLWKECMAIHDEPSSVGHIILNDDLETFEKIAKTEGFDLNQRVLPFIFTFSSFMTSYPTLIQYAAFTGAVKCFKFLLESGADLQLNDYLQFTLAQWAVAGGNTDIIGMLDQKVSMKGCLSMSVKFIRKNLFEWLFSTKFKDISHSDLKGLSPIHYACESGCVSALLICLDNNIDPNISFNTGWSPLHIAAKNGQSSILRILTSHQQIKINKTDAHGWTALHWAASNMHPNSVRILLRHPEINVNIIDKEGQSPLHWAAKNGLPDVITALLSHGNINVNSRNHDGSSPLHLASMKGNSFAVKALLAHPNININIPDDSEVTPLYLAAENGHVAVVKLLMESPGIDINKADTFGYTPLFAACGPLDLHMHETISQLLTAPDIDVDRVSLRQATALHIISENGNTEDVLLVASRSKSVNAQDGFMWTPLHSASSVGNAKAIAALISIPEVDINKTDSSGKPPLFWAIASARDSENGDSHSSVDLLIDKTNLSIRDADGQSPLHVAATVEDEYVISKILESGVDVNAVDKNGKTALHIAVKEDNEKAVSLFLSCPKLDVNIKDSEGKTPLHIAAQFSSLSILSMIIEHGVADINVTDASGSTPLMLATESGNLEKVKVLSHVEGVDLCLTDSLDRTAHLIAVRNGFNNIAEILPKA